jgi:SNF2 family DNA or RNA helicase
MPFQREGVSFCSRNNMRCLIGDEMGLGKTIQAITCAWLMRDEWPLLIVVPASMRYSWIDEIEKWLPDLHSTDICLVRSGQDVGIITGEKKITIVTYGLLQQKRLLAKIQVPLFFSCCCRLLPSAAVC